MSLSTLSRVSWSRISCSGPWRVPRGAAFVVAAVAADARSEESCFGDQWGGEGPRLEAPALQLAVSAAVLRPVEKNFGEGEKGGAERGCEQQVIIEENGDGSAYVLAVELY